MDFIGPDRLLASLGPFHPLIIRPQPFTVGYQLDLTRPAVPLPVPAVCRTQPLVDFDRLSRITPRDLDGATARLHWRYDWFYLELLAREGRLTPAGWLSAQDAGRLRITGPGTPHEFEEVSKARIRALLSRKRDDVGEGGEDDWDSESDRDSESDWDSESDRDSEDDWAAEDGWALVRRWDGEDVDVGMPLMGGAKSGWLRASVEPFPEGSWSSAQQRQADRLFAEGAEHPVTCPWLRLIRVVGPVVADPVMPIYEMSFEFTRVPFYDAATAPGRLYRCAVEDVGRMAVVTVPRQAVEP